jgi:hypothetical protein
MIKYYQRQRDSPDQNQFNIKKLGRKIMGFFDSEIVQQEAKLLFEDYQSLVTLGGNYGKFDREGKKMFIAQMESMMERYRIFMKRFELSEDFMAQMTVEQLKTQLNQFGITPQQMFEQMNSTLERMKSELEKQS